MLQERNSKTFTNGSVHLLRTEDNYPLEVTDTFLPFYTKDAIGRKQNMLDSYDLGDRSQRWLIGVSCMSGCPVRCRFCATGQLKKVRNLTWEEIVAQVMFVVDKNGLNPQDGKEFKINYTRMGEPFLNIDNVRKAIEQIDKMYPNVHHYISTIGVAGSDYSWIKGNITLQLSLHSLVEEKRNWLIPFKHKMSIKELGQVRTNSNLKTTVNMTLVDENDFDIEELSKNFQPENFFIKLSPINENCISKENSLGQGAITGINLV